MGGNLIEIYTEAGGLGSFHVAYFDRFCISVDWLCEGSLDEEEKDMDRKYVRPVLTYNVWRMRESKHNENN